MAYKKSLVSLTVLKEKKPKKSKMVQQNPKKNKRIREG